MSDALIASLQKQIETLQKENYDYREKLRDAKQQITTKDTEIGDLKKKLPADGALVLTGDDAKAWKAYGELGKPADLKSKLEAASDADAKLKALEADAHLSKVTSALGWKADTLKPLADGLIFEIEGKDGDQKVYAKAEGESRVEAAEHPKLKPFLASLAADEKQRGRKWPKQPPSGDPPKGGKSEGELQQSQTKRLGLSSTI